MIELGDAGAQSGFRVGDIITRYGDYPVASGNDVRKASKAHAADGAATVPVALLRNGQELTLQVAPGNLDLGMRTVTKSR